MHPRVKVLTLSAVLASSLVLQGAAAGAPRPILAVPNYGVALLGVTVNYDGTIFPGESSGALSAKRVAVGQYEVTFNRSLYGCTIAVTAASAAPRIGQFSGTLDDPASAFFRIFDAAGAPADSAFTIVAICTR